MKPCTSSETKPPAARQGQIQVNISLYVKKKNHASTGHAWRQVKQLKVKLINDVSSEDNCKSDPESKQTIVDLENISATSLEINGSEG